MPDDLHLKVRKRVERRLSKSPRQATIHALLFTGLSVPVGLWSILTDPDGVMNGVVYWTIFLWSVTWLIHASYLYWHSGARRRRRERTIHEEVLDAGETFDLTADEMLAMHIRLSDEIRLRSQPFRSLMVNALGNLLLWPGVLVIMTVMSRTELMTINQAITLFHRMSLFALLGTFALGLMVLAQQLRGQRSQGYDDLRALYGYKRKRLAEDDVPDGLTAIGDDGELVESEAVRLRQKS